MEIEIVYAKSKRPLLCLYELTSKSSILNVKEAIGEKNSKFKDVNRVELRLEPSGRTLLDDENLEDLNLTQGDALLYIKDRGMQIPWNTVFYVEYAGPLLTYLWIYGRPWLFYGDSRKQVHGTVHLALVCWILHYGKRLLETFFIHRFSNATMPIRNLFKNSSYYWGFAAYVAYHVNHPLYTSPPPTRVFLGLLIFAVCELGNLSIHIAFRDLRPSGSKIRQIPKATNNPFTRLFNYVSCPNYTYEIGAWIGFSLMTQCLPAGFFTLAGCIQMTIWALNKHRRYKKEFSDYPKDRKAILPFLL